MIIGHAKIVQLLLKKGADVNLKNDHGLTPLHGAAEFGLELIMTKLVRLGPSVVVNPLSGRTPLHIAIDTSK